MQSFILLGVESVTLIKYLNQWGLLNKWEWRLRQIKYKIFINQKYSIENC